MAVVERARTAIVRGDFSSPVKLLLSTGLLNKKRTFFDYGSGRGDDVAALRATGYAATGWDPHFDPKSERRPSYVVNLGFVLNVIEDLQERAKALGEAWRITEGVLVISVISAWDKPKGTITLMSDGVLTGKRTFQKYFEPGELKNYVDDTIGTDCTPTSPIQVLCFKDKELEMEYLTNVGFLDFGRAGAGIPLAPTRRERINARINALHDEAPEAWRTLVNVVTTYGCLPSGEWSRVADEFRSRQLTASDVLSAIVEDLGDSWPATVRSVKDAYIARLALAFFRGVPRPEHFSMVEKSAIRAHFGSFSRLLDIAKSTVLSIGRPAAIDESCRRADCGIEDDQALFVHRSVVWRLDPILQTYIGTGRLFYGDLSAVDVFKIHKASGKLTLLLYDDFEKAFEPLLHTRVKIDFRARRVNYFNHRNDGQRLRNKEQYRRLRSMR